MSSEDLKALRERVEAATGADRQIDRDLAEVLVGGEAKPANRWGDGWMAAGQIMVRKPEPYTSSIDEALALMARHVPSMRLYALVDQRPLPEKRAAWFAGFDSGSRAPVARGTGSTAPLAILSALLSALEQQ